MNILQSILQWIKLNCRVFPHLSLLDVAFVLLCFFLLIDRVHVHLIIPTQVAD